MRRYIGEQNTCSDGATGKKSGGALTENKGTVALRSENLST